MKIGKASGRAFKKNVSNILKSDDLDAALVKLSELPSKKVVNALFSFLLSTDENIKWAAVTAMGAVVSEIANKEMEAARVIMRRLMWNLNDESGGIGWGSPEAMGEILACHKGLAEEYSHILLSYIRHDGNYLELEMLQQGLLWGIWRLSQARPYLVKDSVEFLIPYLESNDAMVRGLAAWIICRVGSENARAGLEKIKEDKSQIRIYVNRRFKTFLLKNLINSSH